MAGWISRQLLVCWQYHASLGQGIQEYRVWCRAIRRLREAEVRFQKWGLEHGLASPNGVPNGEVELEGVKVVWKAVVGLARPKDSLLSYWVRLSTPVPAGLSLGGQRLCSQKGMVGALTDQGPSLRWVWTDAAFEAQGVCESPVDAA